MKYLRSYKIFESNPSYKWSKTGRYEVRSFGEIKEDIFDILRDCEDLGLFLSVRNNSKQILITLSYLENKDRITDLTNSFAEIKTSIEHLISYMKSNGYDNFRCSDNISGFNRKRVDNILPPTDRKNRESYICLTQILFF